MQPKYQTGTGIRQKFIPANIDSVASIYIMNAGKCNRANRYVIGPQSIVTNIIIEAISARLAINFPRHNYRSPLLHNLHHYMDSIQYCIFLLRLPYDPLAIQQRP